MEGSYLSGTLDPPPKLINVMTFDGRLNTTHISLAIRNITAMVTYENKMHQRNGKYYNKCIIIIVPWTIRLLSR